MSSRPQLRYTCDASLLNPALAHAFVELDADADTLAFVAELELRPTGALRAWMRRGLGGLMSDYDANALLDTHDMRVLGTEQWRTLLDDGARGRLLDLGAGDGRVTTTLAPLFDEVVTNELSKGMARRLRQRGYECWLGDLAEQALPESFGRFHVVCMLNLLDRCRRPRTLLSRARDLLEPEGRLIVAAPLPLSPHVHVGAHTVDPEELLPIERSSFEAAANRLAADLFEAQGLVTERWTRTPYLCRGDAHHPISSLDDAVFVLRLGSSPTT
ncbi:MAG: methyltransferase domain-containing protein [Deltaproteobacteria bacterium]|nr:methyltransferase domain-containing protein [Deltaproteobacteria bacterium]